MRADDELTHAQSRHVEIEAQIVTLSEGEDLEPQLRDAQAGARLPANPSREARVLLASLERDRRLRGKDPPLAADITRWTGAAR